MAHPDKISLGTMRVQVGSYLDEDDIIHIEDIDRRS